MDEKKTIGYYVETSSGVPTYLGSVPVNEFTYEAAQEGLDYFENGGLFLSKDSGTGLVTSAVVADKVEKITFEYFEGGNHIV